MGFLPTTATFSYGQRSKCADLLNSYLLPDYLAKVFTVFPHDKVVAALPRSCGVKSAGNAAWLNCHQIFLKKVLDGWRAIVYNDFRCSNGLSPNGKATDSDSVISRFESL